MIFYPKIWTEICLRCHGLSSCCANGELDGIFYRNGYFFSFDNLLVSVLADLSKSGTKPLLDTTSVFALWLSHYGHNLGSVKMEDWFRSKHGGVAWI